MRFKTLALVAVAAFVLAPSIVFGAAPCCDGKACCQQMAACCQQDGDKAAAAVLLPQVDPQTVVVRQAAGVWFMKPVKVGDSILQGQYIIEHDNDRMARGLPCTHIYAANKPQVPVVKFHCTHLERARAERDTVVLHSTGDPMIPGKLAAFQFAGETAAHGIPSVR